MSKEQSNFAHKFKGTTAAGIDTRVLRAQRRSMEWKESRDQVVSRRRNVKAMSPVLEAKGAENSTKETSKTSKRGDAVSDKVANRKAQLMKWKEQKDLRKKVEELEKAKKKPFRVVHMEPEVVPFKNFSLKLQQVAAVQDTNAASTKLPSTRSKTVGAEPQHDITTSRNTRSKVAPVVASSGVGTKSTRETRSKSSSVVARTGIPGKGQKKSDHEPNSPGKAKLPAKASHVKLSTGIGKTELKTAAAPERETRSRTKATVVSVTKAVAPSHLHLSSASSSAEDMVKVFDFSYSRLKKVTMKRGSELSFAPADFRFTAPENVKPFSFNKLNSSDETSDIEKKATVIESSTDEMSLSSGGGTSTAKRQTRKSTKITSTPQVPEIQEEFLRTPAVSAVPSGVLAVVQTSDCVVLVEKLQSCENDTNVGPVFSMMQGKDKRSRRKSRSSMSRSSVDENRNGDRSRSNLRQLEDRMDDNQRANTSPDEPQRSLRSLKKRKSNGVALRSVLGQLKDSNDVSLVTRKSQEKMGTGSVKSKETTPRNRRSVVAKEVTKRSEESGTRSACPSKDVCAAPMTSDKKPMSETVIKKSGRRESRSVVPKADVMIATEGSKRRSVVKLISNVSIGDSDIEPAEKIAKEDYMSTIQAEKTLERVLGARRSIRGKPTPGCSISDDDGAKQIDKISEETLETESADENETKKMKASKNSKSGIDTNRPAVAAEVVMETAETSVKASPDIVTETDSQRVEETGNNAMERKVQNTSAAVFQTPSQPIRAMRSRSIALGLDSLKRKTPKNVRNSLILRALSPEEGVEVLKNSPMIELNRRKLKTPPTGSRIGNQIAPMPNFDDLDVDTDLSKDESKNGSADNPAASPAGKDLDGVKRFRWLVSSETDRLKALCLRWKETLISDAEQLSEEVSGQIRTTIGQAELLMGQRFKQFSGLVDDCEFKTSEKEVTCSDLQGFWDMIYFQVEDVDKKYSDLDKLKAVNWVVENVSVPVKPKAAKKKVGQGTKTTDAAKKASNRPNFAQFRQKLQQQQGQEAEAKVMGTILVASPNSEVKTFDGCFFKVDSPVLKRTRASTEKQSSLHEVGNTPKATTSVARVVLQRMTRKSLIQSIHDSEQNPTVPSSETNVKHTSPSESQQYPFIQADEQQMTSVNRNEQNETERRSTRKSVYFSEVVTDCDTLASNFSKYLLPSSDSVISTPDLSCQLEDKSLLSSTETENTPVVNVEMDEVPVKGFKGLRLGFTPGVDGKSRRISSFTPQPNGEKTSAMGRITENSEIISDLMTFSPLTCTSALNETSGESGRKSGVQKRCSTRRSVVNKLRMSLL